ncbi:adrenodoxin-like [Myripristis murdjan]|uniref:Adrenodoxin-like n=1 Tax=Myripristis murdjan TaxID=586833 RepID=A0A668AUZ9_9TELE|nr:adrenodoxin-like [Myripristis murdjan]
MSAARRLLRFNPRLLQSRTNKRTAAVTGAAATPPHTSVGNAVLFSGSAQCRRPEGRVTVHFINRDGQKITTSGAEGDSLLDVVVDQKLDIPGYGACEGTLACSTCHLILEQEVYDQLGHIIDEEQDMLDLAYGLTETSRLGCQVCLSRSLEGATVRVPAGLFDMRRADSSGSSSSA